MGLARGIKQLPLYTKPGSGSHIESTVLLKKTKNSPHQKIWSNKNISGSSKARCIT